MKRKHKRVLNVLFLVCCLSYVYYMLDSYNKEIENKIQFNLPDSLGTLDFLHNKSLNADAEKDLVIENPNHKVSGKIHAGKNSLPFDWENKRPNEFDYPKLQLDRLGNYEIESSEKKRAGAGEYGEAVILDKSLDSAAKDSIAEFGFNIVASDRISLDRAPKDLRHEQCKHWDYPPHLTSVSVVIVFHNEAWSPLMRTVHNVINYTPREYLHEIVMIDDGSQKDHLGAKLDEYVTRFNGIVKVYRNRRREGLIRARSIGAKRASGQILVYLDAHCEAEPNWLPPLITPILNDHRTCTVPLIDLIDGNKYTFSEQAGGDSDGLARGAWDWSFRWKRIPLTKKEKSFRKQITEPYRSPAMAGGLFAIDRDYFFEIGLYDDGLDIWGGENFELSHKVWMCGGQLLFVPCSRIGHVYRLDGWRGNPPPAYVRENALLRNYKRVIETWWDEYDKYFYMRMPEVRTVDTGDLTEQKAVRQRLHCRSFDWLVKEIAYDIPKHFPPIEPPSGASGKVTNIGTNLCLDGRHDGNGSPVYIRDCEKPDTEPKWWITWREDIRPGEITLDSFKKVCLDCIGRDNMVTFWECHHMQGNQLWKYIVDRKQLFHSLSNSCLEASPKENKVYARECNHNNKNQLWTFTTLNITQLSIFNSDMHKAVFLDEV